MLPYCTGGRKVHANVNVFIGRTFELFNATCETTVILFNPFSNGEKNFYIDAKFKTRLKTHE